MKLDDILNITMHDINRMNASELKEVTQAISKVANRRRRALEKAGLTKESQAYQNTLTGKKGTGKFTTRGKNRNRLLNEFVRATNFINSQTSTVRGTKKVKKNLSNLLSKSEEKHKERQEKQGVKTKPKTKSKKPKSGKQVETRSKEEIEKAKENLFWKMFNNVKNKRPELLQMAGDSHQLLRLVQEVMDNSKSENYSYLNRKLQKEITMTYEHENAYYDSLDGFGGLEL